MCVVVCLTIHALTTMGLRVDQVERHHAFSATVHHDVLLYGGLQVLVAADRWASDPHLGRYVSESLNGLIR